MTDENPVIIIDLDSASASSQNSVEENEGTSSGQDSESVPPVAFYVNPKQYTRILKRRLSRAKLEAQGRIPKVRQKILHESRSRHARNRPRDDKGKFIKQEETKDFKFMIITN